jgi:hypothetical protein
MINWSIVKVILVVLGVAGLIYTWDLAQMQRYELAIGDLDWCLDLGGDLRGLSAERWEEYCYKTYHEQE